MFLVVFLFLLRFDEFSPQHRKNSLGSSRDFSLLFFLEWFASFPAPLREPLGIVEAPCFSCFFFLSFCSYLVSSVGRALDLSKFWGLFPRLTFLCQDSVWSPGVPFFVLYLRGLSFFPFLVSHLVQLPGVSLGVGFQFSLIVLGQFLYSGFVSRHLPIPSLPLLDG